MIFSSGISTSCCISKAGGAVTNATFAAGGCVGEGIGVTVREDSVVMEPTLVVARAYSSLNFRARK